MPLLGTVARAPRQRKGAVAPPQRAQNLLSLAKRIDVCEGLDARLCGEPLRQAMLPLPQPLDRGLHLSTSHLNLSRCFQGDRSTTQHVP